MRRAGPGWTVSEQQDATLARVDALLARTVPGELSGDDKSLSRDGCTLAMHHPAEGQATLIVTSGATLPPALARVLLGLLMSVDVLPEDARFASAA
jgi:hypothetical protein